ncbi:MAG: ABC transporter permease [Bacteroidetes bacterium]|nr:ABC transporter permease [Bacteroidota bacterium]
MLTHYLKIALRNLWKKKAFSAINLLGLTVGLSCCLMIGLYINHELNYDNFQQKGNRIVRVIMEYSFSGSVNRGNFTSTKVYPAFKKNFPEVEEGVRMSQRSRIVKYGNKLFDENRFLFADSTFFDLFSFPLLEGNNQKALSGLNKVVLTRSTATKYFGQDDPVGKIINIGSDGDSYEVTGVIGDCPANSQIKFDFLASFSSLGETQEETYYDANFTTYLLLKNKNSVESLQQKIPAFMKKELGKEYTADNYITFFLEPFTRIHLYSPYDGFEPNGSITYVYIIGAVALLILAIACFTYINLSTARSIERAKEVGIRKVSGAYKTQIFAQFIGESLILSVAGLLLSIVVVIFLLPAFNHLAEREIHISALLSPFSIIFCLLIIICISLLAGSYPAFVLSSYQPVKVLKGLPKKSGSGLWLRKSLIVFQFVISVFLIVATAIMQKQLYFIQHKKLGYERDHVLVLPLDSKIMTNIVAFKNELKATGYVKNVSSVRDAPTHILGGYSMNKEGMSDDTHLMVTADPVDEEFIKTVGLELIAGSDFTQQDIKDVWDVKEQKDRKYHYVLNESAAKALGWTPQEAIGKKMFLGEQRPGFVKGVVKDFHFSSMHDPIKPLVIFQEEWGNFRLLVRISSGDISKTISQIESKWKTFAPHRPFEYYFLDEDYDKLYGAELRTGKIMNIFATIAILLATLGLFGLSAFTAQQRTKEIGVRKILGAGMFQIVGLLSKDFVKLVVIATLIALPLAGYMMNKWLQDFFYRIDMSWWIFAIAAISSALIALITVSFQAIKAAGSNPVKALRTE